MQQAAVNRPKCRMRFLGAVVYRAHALSMGAVGEFVDLPAGEDFAVCRDCGFKGFDHVGLNSFDLDRRVSLHCVG